MKCLKTIEMVFDKDSPLWSTDVECNKMLVKAVEMQVLHLVKTNGWASLNDAFDLLGLTRNVYGLQLGWTTDNILTEDLFDIYTTDGTSDLIIDFNRLTYLF